MYEVVEAVMEEGYDEVFICICIHIYIYIHIYPPTYPCIYINTYKDITHINTYAHPYM
jgi:hypothetical protein